MAANQARADLQRQGLSIFCIEFDFIYSPQLAVDGARNLALQVMSKPRRDQVSDVHKRQLCSGVAEQFFGSRVRISKIPIQIERKQNLHFVGRTRLAHFTINFMSHDSSGTRTLRDPTRTSATFRPKG